MLCIYFVLYNSPNNFWSIFSLNTHRTVRVFFRGGSEGLAHVSNLAVPTWGSSTIGPKSRLHSSLFSYTKLHPCFWCFPPTDHRTVSSNRPGQYLAISVVYGGCVFICIGSVFVCSFLLCFYYTLFLHPFINKLYLEFSGMKTFVRKTHLWDVKFKI